VAAVGGIFRIAGAAVGADPGVPGFFSGFGGFPAFSGLMKRQVDASTVFLPAGTVIRRAAFRTNYNVICICEDLSADDAFFSGVYSHSVSLFSKCFFNNFFRCVA
jgi:hypothetical protein